MIDEETKNLIKNRMDSLPEVVQNAILNSGWQDKIRQLGKKYSLHIDQIGILENQTFIVLLGLEDPDGFQNNLTTGLGITSLIAQQISIEINETIFKPIRQQLQALQATEEDKENEENPTKESILAGIEDPEPVIHPHEHEAFPPLASQLAMPAPLDRGEIIPIQPATYNQLYEIRSTPKKPGEVPETSSLPKVTVMPNAGTSNIVHDKLSQMVQMAKEEIKIQQ